MRDVPTRLEFTTDPQLLGLSVSPAQRALIKSLDGHALDAEERELWQQCTGRARYPEGHAFPEVTVIAGARSGKDSRVAAPGVCYEACFGGHEAHLGRGEHGVIVLVAQDAKATRVALGYVKDYMTRSPLLKPLVEEEREAEIWLTNRMRIVCFASTSKSIRGWSIPAAVMDEVGFFRLEAAGAADVEIQTSIRRGGVGFPAPRLIKISTAYLRSGVLWDDFSRYWGADAADVLVWRAPTALMNPTIDAARLAREQRVDPQRFAREYLGEFGDDVEAFLPGAWIEAAVVEGRRELPPVAGVRYLAAGDPSGGAVKGDAFTLAIVHAEGDQIVQDVMKGWTSTRGQTVELAAVCAEVAAIIARYETFTVYGDHFAGLWPEQEFRKVGVFYQQSEFDKSKAYRELEPQLAQGRVDLLDEPTLARELRQLERRYKPGGKIPTIDHPRGGHDDHANALAIAVAELAKSMQPAISMSKDLGPVLARQPRAAQEPVGAEATGRATFWNERGTNRFWRSGR